MEAAYQESVLPGGIACYVPAGRSMSGFVLREQGDWFEPELGFLRRLVRPGWRCVDVGAACGCYALSLAAAAGPTGSVLAIEPHRTLAGALAKGSQRLTGAAPIRLETCAIAEQAGEGHLSDPENPELAALTPDGPIPVATATLDSLAADDIDVLKIDVAGGGSAALAGAQRILSHGRAIVQFVIRHGGQIQAGSCVQLMRAGYLMHRLVPGLDCLAPLLPGEPLDPFAINAIAVPVARMEELRARGKLVGVIDGQSPLPDGIAVQSVIDGLAKAPWIARFKPAWQPNAIFNGWEHQRRAVAMQTLSEDGALPLEQRAACLFQAQSSIGRALAAAMSGSRLATAVRIFMAAGNRADAVRALEALQPLVKADSADYVRMFGEPFLLPMRMHEDLPFTSSADMIRCAALESGAFLSVHSAFFQGANRLATYEQIGQLPVHSQRATVVLEMLRAQNQRQAPMVLRF